MSHTSLHAECDRLLNTHRERYSRLCALVGRYEGTQQATGTVDGAALLAELAAALDLAPQGGAS